MSELDQEIAAVPAHHLRYATAWTLYQESDLPPSAVEILQIEMDSAQEEFTYEEFQDYKKTLPHFLAYWDAWSLKIQTKQKELTAPHNPPPLAD